MPELSVAPRPLPAAPHVGPSLGHAGIASLAAAVPERRVSNEQITARLDVDSDWIVTRTGVHERRRLAPGETLVDLAARAAHDALGLADLEPDALDLVLFATFTPDALQPHAAPMLVGRLGAGGAAAIDVGAACSGFVAALSLASAQLESGRAENVLVVGADAVSSVLDYDDAATAGLFGDGAGAAVLQAGGPGAIGPVVQGSDPEGLPMIAASRTERLIRMDGRPTFRAAVATLERTTHEAIAARGLELDDIDLFVYHQANARILSAVGDRLGLASERVVDCIGRFGNTSAASIPIALGEAASEGRLRRGSKVLLGAFGAGFTWASTVIDWEGAA
jgi:3-oxoacyl-[acyl-carrier-protein] synthase III